MDEYALRELVRRVRAGRAGRRDFIQAMVGLGVTAPLAARILASAGRAQAQARAPEFAPTRRGGGGVLKTLW
jgi:peptide/nickel transport system substrate-binding protein